jgi:hypothetical protein
MRRNRKLSKGFVLAMALILTGIIMVLCTAVASLGIQQSGISYNVSMNGGAQSAAMAGIDEAMDMLYYNPDWGRTSPSTDTELVNKPLAHVRGSFNVTFITSSPFFSTNNINGTADVTRSDGIVVPVGYAYIVSTGRVLGQTQRVAAMVCIPYTEVTAGVIAGGNSDTVKISGGHVTGGAMVNNPGGGTILTTSTDPQAISSQIDGEIYVPGGNTAYVAIPPNIASHVHTAPVIPSSFFNPESQPAGLPTYSAIGANSAGSPLAPGNYTCALTNSVYLGPGKYCFDSIGITGNKAVTISGVGSGQRCEIYLRGNMEMGGNAVFNNTMMDPSKVRISGGPGCTSIWMHGNGTTIANLFAPCAEFKLSGGGNSSPDFFGAMVIDHATGSGSHVNIWYDTMMPPTRIKQQPRMYGFNHL